MSEEWLRDAVSEHVESVLESMDQRVLSISVGDDSTEVLDGLAQDSRNVIAACLPVRDFDDLIPVLENFEILVQAIKERKVTLDSKLGGLLLQSVHTFRFAVKNLNAPSKASEALPRILKDLAGVYSKLLSAQTAAEQADIAKTVELYLTVKIGEETFLVPCNQVDRVLRNPEVSEALSAHPTVKRVVCDAGKFMPLLEGPVALGAATDLVSTPAAAEQAGPISWALVLRPSKEATVVSFSVDDVGEVLESPAGFAQKVGAEREPTLLDLRDIAKKLGVT